MGRRGGGERGRKYPKILTPEQWRQVVAAAGEGRGQELLGARDRAILAVLFGSGIRCFELVALDLPDIAKYTEERGWVPTGVIHVRHGKGDKERFAPLARFGVQELEAYLDVRPDCALQDGDQVALPVFVSRQGGRLKERMVRYLVKAAGERAGLDFLHPHTARHSNATAQVRKAAEKKEPLFAVADNLGHASLDTLRIYTHLDVESRKALVDDL